MTDAKSLPCYPLPMTTRYGEASRNEALKQALAQIDAAFRSRVARKCSSTRIVNAFDRITEAVGLSN